MNQALYGPGPKSAIFFFFLIAVAAAFLGGEKVRRDLQWGLSDKISLATSQAERHAVTCASRDSFFQQF